MEDRDKHKILLKMTLDYQNLKITQFLIGQIMHKPYASDSQ